MLVYSESSEKAAWVPRARVRCKTRARPFGFTTPQQGEVAADDWSTAKQVGPRLDRGVLDAGLFDPEIHEPWMCVLIYARMSLTAQRLDKTLLPMFLRLVHDETVRSSCTTAAGGRFSKALTALFTSVGMSPGTRPALCTRT